MIENVIIIGGGPAGLAAAIYLARANLNPLVFAGSPPGGQLILTSEVENYPGFDSILGAELIEKMRNQAKKFGARIVDENVLRVEFSEPIKTVFVRRQSLIKTQAIIIATGAKALWLNLPSEQRLRGHGVSACATCDGFFFRNKTVAVVGGGDTALEEALTLTKFAKKVYIIHRRDSFRASKIMQDRVFANKKIEIIYNAVVEEIMGKKKVTGIKVKSKILNHKSQINHKFQKQNSKRLEFGISNLFGTWNLEFRILPVDGVFIAIGHKPDTEIFNGQVKMDKKGYIITTDRIANDLLKSQILNLKSQINPKSQIQNSKRLKFENLDLFGTWNLEFGVYRSSTSVKGVFAAGDCADPYYRQAVTAAGTGVEAALEVERWLNEI